MLGNWAIIEADTLYSEVYIDSVSFYYYIEEIGFVSPKNYSLKGNKLFFWNKTRTKTDDWAFLKIINNQISIEFPDKTNHLNQISQEEFNIDDIKNEKDITIYKKNFLIRKSKLVNTDSN